jgi:hypothetical protein
VLEGRIYLFGDRIRVNAQLIRLRDGETLWADRFEDNYTDVFRVQDVIARKVADSLVARLSRSEAIMLSRQHTVNSEAYRAYLKGRFFWAKRTEAGLVTSIDEFRRALTFDPNYALTSSYTVFQREIGVKPTEACNRSWRGARKMRPCTRRRNMAFRSGATRFRQKRNSATA